MFLKGASRRNLEAEELRGVKGESSSEKLGEKSGYRSFHSCEPEDPELSIL